MTDFKDKVTDICFSNGGVTKPMVDKIAQLTLSYIEELIGPELEVAGIKDLEEKVYIIPAQNKLRQELRNKAQKDLS